MNYAFGMYLNDDYTHNMICESITKHDDLLKTFNNLWDQKINKKSKGKSSKFHLKTKNLLKEAKNQTKANE